MKSWGRRERRRIKTKGDDEVNKQWEKSIRGWQEWKRIVVKRGGRGKS